MSGRCLTLLTLLLASGLVFGDEPPQTGSYTASFTQRSPMSSLKTLGQRFGIAKPEPDYDLGGEKFLIHVPPNYDPAKPMGLIVQLIYKDETAQLNAEDLKILDSHNLAIITRCHGGGEMLSRGGCALDAAYNMQQRYAIDPTRLYLFAFIPNENVEDLTGLRVFTGFPEVFSGGLLYGINYFWAPMKSADGGLYEVKVKPPPPPAQRTAAAKHPLVLLFGNNDDAFAKIYTKAWTSQGFRNVKSCMITLDDFHYPNFTPGWFTESIDFLDALKPAAAATKPSTSK